jgi:hypothetical protein
MPKSISIQIKVIEEKLTELHQWSKNFEPGKNPFALFLDIIGYSDEILGTNLIAEPSKVHEFMGYTEYVMLGDALKVFNTNSYLTVYEACMNLLKSEEQQ